LQRIWVAFTALFVLSIDVLSIIQSRSLLVWNALHQFSGVGCVEELLLPDVPADFAVVIFVAVIGGVGRRT